MKCGINIGDHFELDFDKSLPFENPVKDWYYKAIVDLGFDHVRLPVKWSWWTDDDNGYKIDKIFFDEVEKTVNKLLDCGLEVVLNIHHFREAMDFPRENAEKIFAIWEQVGERFKNHSDKLIFEVMNEPTWKTTPEEWNEVQEEALKVIRKTNPTRRVMVCGIDYSGLVALDNLKLPKDDNLIATFHFYDPFEFTHQGAPWSATMKDSRGVHWFGSDDDKEFIMARFVAHAKNFQRRNNGIPMNLGEFGAYHKHNEMSEVIEWTKCVRETCEKLGYSWTYWEFNRSFGIYTRDGKPKHELIDALLKE